MRTLARLMQSLPAVKGPALSGSMAELEVRGITCDSRAVVPGTIFVAVRGGQADGHDFIADAVAAGCLAVVAEQVVDATVAEQVPLYLVPDSQEALGVLAAAYNGFPAAGLTLVGLTGTNGKTTTSWLVENLFVAAGKSCGVIGTVNYRYRDDSGRQVVQEAALTTPDPVLLQRLLREMADAGVSHVVMEVSSHGLVRRRLAGLRFDVGVFTNLSRDHLDFHHSMDDYFAAKTLLFDRYLKPDAPAVVVIGEERAEEDWGRRLAEHLGSRRVIRCGLATGCQVTATGLRQDIDGLAARLVVPSGECELRSGLTGRYNLLNLLTAAGIGHALGMKPEIICQGLARVSRVPGRLERIRLPGQQPGMLPAVFVDYAHTPDALANVLSTMADLARGRLVCVFGCGGDRDRGKRPLMGRAAARCAEVVIVTSDNPRSEEPGAIIAGILPGLRDSGLTEQGPEQLFCARTRGYMVEEDRREAIRLACSLSGSDDVVVIAGKGHETYQLRGRERIFFDDRREAAEGLLAWNLVHLLAATGGELIRGHCGLLSGRVVTDTRKLAAGDVFVALRGENFDGHDFVARAVAAGAGALIIDRRIAVPRDRDVPVILVGNTEQALGDLAAYRRRLLAPDLRVAAVTGSSGKTTVKEMTAAIFTAHAEAEAMGPDTILRTEGNFNNLIGLPLTLLSLRATHRLAVVEMGMNRPGEIGRLTAIADPDIGCITNVQGVHLEGLGSIEGVAAAKGELYATMGQRAIRVVNCDDPLVRALAAKQGGRTVGFAVTPAGRRHRPLVRATRILSRGEEGICFTLHIGDWHQRLTVPAPGEHNVSNCVAAAAIAHAAGIAPEIIVRGLERFQTIDRRMQLLHLAGGLRVVNDAYNANPASMAAALRTVAGFGSRCRRVAVLGDMLELGAETVRAHRRIGQLVAELGYDLLAVTGHQAEEVAVAARAAGMARDSVRVFSDTEGICEWLYLLLVSGDLVGGDWLLVKGSRGMRMERVIDGLIHRFDPQIGQED